MSYLFAALFVAGIGIVGWKLTARSAYESAEYTIIESDGSFEIRQYPDLMLASTPMKSDSQGSNGSFSRLFQYISGGNDSKTNVAMTTPVFMEPDQQDSTGQMGFVIPKAVVLEQIPNPAENSVQIRKRIGGQFAVLRFSGRLNEATQAENERKLRDWIAVQGKDGNGKAEFAGYDPPWTPGPFRRNEVLIRLN